MALEQAGMGREQSRRRGIRNAWRNLQHGKGPRPAELRDLATAIGELERVNRATEADFLMVAEKLGGLLSAARTVSLEVGAISRTIGGNQATDHSNALLDVLHYVRQMEQRATATNELIKLRESARRTRRGIAGFEQAVPAFRVMAVLAQIETARLGSAGLDLGHLADEIRSWSDHIRSRVEHILTGAGILEERIESALGDAAEFDRKSLRALPAVIESVERGLQEFESRRLRTAAIAADLARHFDSLSRAIGDIVTSVQGHDITRQQVEHVIESLRGSGSSLPPAAVIDLQVAQLENASRTFSNAVHQMDARLEAVARQVQAMADDSGKFLSSADRREDSFLAQIEASFHTIAAAITGCGELEKRTNAAAAEVRKTVERVLTSVGEIHAVDIQLRRLALNASVSAAHLGAQGQPLEMVAAAMQQLQAGCEASARETDDAVHSIVMAMDSVGSAGKKETGAGDEVIRNLRFQIGMLHHSTAEATAKYMETTDLAFGLSRDIQKLRAGISAGDVFTGAISRSCGLLRGIRAGAMREHRAAGSAQLQQVRSLYTMNAEREVHRRATGEGTEAAPPVEIGTNVEFF